MALRNRTVYYYVPIQKDKDEKPIDVPADFWVELWNSIHDLENSGFDYSHFGSRFIVRAMECKSPAVRYLYVGKLRSREDWPDVEESQEIRRLQESGLPGNLVEAAYLVHSGHEQVVSVVRTTGGPSVGAIGAGISHQFADFSTGESFELAPYVRNDQFQRLMEAEGATRIHLKLDTDEMKDVASKGGVLASAFNEATAIDDEGLMSLDLVMSFGNNSVPEAQRSKLAGIFKQLLRTPKDAGAFSKAEATLVSRDGSGRLTREKVNFVCDRITMKSQFGQVEDQQPNPEDIISGILEANQEFREKFGAAR